MNHHSSSYNPAACCKTDCWKFDSNSPDDPCWGDVDVIDEEGGEDWYWIHSCQGHKDEWNNSQYNTGDPAVYVPEPEPQAIAAVANPREGATD